MAVQVKLVGLPDLGKTIELETCPPDVGHLVRTLVRKLGAPGAKYLLDSSGSLDPAIQVIVNDKSLAKTGSLANYPLQDGDQVILMLMAAGG